MRTGCDQCGLLLGLQHELYGNDGTNRYNALQIKVDQRAAAGLTLNGVLYVLEGL